MSAAAPANVIPIVLKAPTPEHLDELAREYNKLDEECTAAKAVLKTKQEALEVKEDELRELVKKFGSAHAKKSKMLYGLDFEVMATFGMSTAIDAAAVERFRQALLKAKRSTLLRELFEKTVQWTLKAEASVIVQAKKLPDKLVALWAVCEVKTPKTATVTVRPRKKQA